MNKQAQNVETDDQFGNFLEAVRLGQVCPRSQGCKSYQCKCRSLISHLIYRQVLSGSTSDIRSQCSPDEYVWLQNCLKATQLQQYKQRLELLHRFSDPLNSIPFDMIGIHRVVETETESKPKPEKSQFHIFLSTYKYEIIFLVWGLSFFAALFTGIVMSLMAP